MNRNNNNINNQPEDQQQFIFSQNTTNKVTPKAIKVLPEFDEMLCSKDINLGLLMDNLSKENFDKNELFNMDNDEKKLIKSYQFLFQYFKYSITSLQQQCQLVENLSNQQSQYNMKADELIHRQTSKITALDCRNKDLNDNMLGMEFLIKSLNIDTDISDINTKARINDIKVKDDDEKNNIQEYKSNYDIGDNNKIDSKDRVLEKNIFRRTLEEGNNNVVDVEKSKANNNPDYYSGSFGEFSGNADRDYFKNVIGNNNNYEHEDNQDKNKEAFYNNEINNHDNNQYTLNNDNNNNYHIGNEINSNHINTNVANNSNHIKNLNYNCVDKNTLESNRDIRDRNLNIKNNSNYNNSDKNLISNNKFSNYNTEENERTPDIITPNKETISDKNDNKDNEEAIKNNSYNSNINDQIKENIEASYGELDTVDKENEIIEISDIKGTQSQHKYSSLNKPSSSIENVKSSNNNGFYNKNSLMLSDDYGDYGEFDN